MSHEVIHALREMGAFSDDEWELLREKALSDWLDDPELNIRERYADRSPEEQVGRRSRRPSGAGRAGCRLKRPSRVCSTGSRGSSSRAERPRAASDHNVGGHLPRH